MGRRVDSRAHESIWDWAWIRAHPVGFTGIQIHLLLRTFFALFWLAAGVNKLLSGWVTSDVLRQVFLERLTQIPPDAFAAYFLQYFAVPLYLPVALVMIVGEIYAGVGLLFGFTTRLAAGISMFILVCVAVGGYYDASLIPFFLMNLMFLGWRSGLWLGVDRYLARRYPDGLPSRAPSLTGGSPVLLSDWSSILERRL